MLKVKEEQGSFWNWSVVAWGNTFSLFPSLFSNNTFYWQLFINIRSKNSGKGDDEEAVDDEIVEEESGDAEGTDGAVDEKSTRKPPRQRVLK